jgi:MerR family transcriptional regulator, copper efflux regulator
MPRDRARRGYPRPVATAPDPAPIACSLDAGSYRDRAAEWRAVLLGAEVTTTPGGRRVRVPAGRAARLAALVEAERACCPFLEFALAVDGDAATLEVRAPAEAEPILAGLFTRTC